ncbi:MAG: choice-of-anchor X domain-containing protein [Plesiomonas sp.]
MLFMLFPALLQAQSTPSSISTAPFTSVLANRFRLDTAPAHLTIVVTRKRNSEPLTLVQPDGSKLFARNPVDNVQWWRSDTHELITITAPMLGPWQVRAEGQTVLKVQTFSDIQIRADRLPTTLYQHEQLTFTARLVQRNQWLAVPELIKNTTLHAVFIPLGELTSAEKERLSLPDNSQAKRELLTGSPISAGRLEDNGQGLDAVAGDGVFSQQLALTMPTGHYWVELRTGEGVALPETGQWVEVKALPVKVLFTQAHAPEQQHVLTLVADPAEVAAGSLQVRVEERLPEESVTIGYRAQAENQAYKVQVQLPYRAQLGHYSLQTWVYLQTPDQRVLSLLLPVQRFRVITNAAVREQQQALIAQQQAEQDEWQKMLSDQEQAFSFSQQKGMQRMQWVLIGGSLLALLVMLSLWGGMRWRKQIQRRKALLALQRQASASMQIGQRDFSVKK